jgi:flagellin
MASVINTNIASLNAQRNLTTSATALTTSLQRLSSGLRINSAKDDAAGMAISTRMTAQINGLNQAARNANDGISLAQTAEGSLNSITDGLQRLRELAVQSSNATNSATDRAAIQSEANQLTAEITRVAATTQFNGVNLLDGTFKSQAFQVGANANQTISITSIGDSRAAALGSHTLAADGSITGNVVTAASGAVTNGVDAAVAATGFTLTTANSGTPLTSSPVTYAVNAGADAIATAINNAGAGIGVSATASNSATLTGLSSAGALTFTLNSQAISVTVADKNDLSAVVSAINGVQAGSGVTAAFTSTGAKNSITLSTTDGRNINLQDYTNAAGATEAVVFDGATLAEGTAVSAVKTGTVSLSSNKGQITTAAASTEVFSGAIMNSTFTSVAAMDLSTADGAQNAIAALDSALSQVNSSRGDLGAYQNRFSSAVSNLMTTTENLTASRSRIQDADFAAETAAMTRGQILQQAGTAILAQANSLPNSVLSLLK